MEYVDPFWVIYGMIAALVFEATYLLDPTTNKSWLKGVSDAVNRPR